MCRRRRATARAGAVDRWRQASDTRGLRQGGRCRLRLRLPVAIDAHRILLLCGRSPDTRAGVAPTTPRDRRGVVAGTDPATVAAADRIEGSTVEPGRRSARGFQIRPGVPHWLPPVPSDLDSEFLGLRQSHCASTWPATTSTASGRPSTRPFPLPRRTHPVSRRSKSAPRNAPMRALAVGR
jgi:hypothetical protein